MSSPITIKRSTPFIPLFCYLFISLFLIACDKTEVENQTEKPKAILMLSDENIEQFTSSFSQDYLTALNALVKGFHAYRKADDSFGFVQFRNHKWTPIYIEKKNDYHAIQQHNSSYISKQPVAPLFTAFENMIFHGLALKNALLDNDASLIEETLLAIEKDQKIVINIANSIEH